MMSSYLLFPSDSSVEHNLSLGLSCKVSILISYMHILTQIPCFLHLFTASFQITFISFSFISLPLWFLCSSHQSSSICFFCVIVYATVNLQYYLRRNFSNVHFVLVSPRFNIWIDDSLVSKNSLLKIQETVNEEMSQRRDFPFHFLPFLSISYTLRRVQKPYPVLTLVHKRAFLVTLSQLKHHNRVHYTLFQTHKNGSTKLLHCFLIENTISMLIGVVIVMHLHFDGKIQFLAYLDSEWKPVHSKLLQLCISNIYNNHCS